MMRTVMTPDQKAAMAEMRTEIARRNTEGLFHFTTIRLLFSQLFDHVGAIFFFKKQIHHNRKEWGTKE